MYVLPVVSMKEKMLLLVSTVSRTVLPEIMKKKKVINPDIKHHMFYQQTVVRTERRESLHKSM